MIEKMEKLYIYSLKDQTVSIMEEVLKCGVIQTEKAESMLPEDTSRLLKPSDSIDLSREEALLERIQENIDELKPFAKKRGLFYQRPFVGYEELTDEKVLADCMGICSDIEKVGSEIRQLKKEKRDVEFKAVSYTPWESMDLKAEDLRTKKSGTALYILPAPRTHEDIRQAIEEHELPAYSEEIFEEKENHYVAVLYHEMYEKKVKSILTAFGAREFVPGDITGSFSENMALCREEAERLEKLIEEKTAELEKLAPRRDELEMASDSIKVRIQCMSGKDQFLQTDTVEIITGWIPVSGKEKVAEALDRYDCFYECKVPEKDEEYPVLMKNSKLVEPFGAITEMYSLPSSNSIDTNWAIGFFFFLFFGMMLSDAGYGLILLIGGLAGAKFLDIGDGAKRLLKMLGLCGISTIFWGALYGSWFGDAIPNVARTFLGTEVNVPQLIDPLNEPMTVLILSCILGVVHIFIGMGIKAYIMIKRGDKWGALFDVGFWYVFLIGLPLLLTPAPFKTVGIVMSIAGGLGLVCTQGRAKPTIVGKITGGIMSLYDITGYFSDVLSYSRVLALGLATGVVASVVNIMGTMPGGSIIGFIVFIVIFLAGHALNMGINALGAYVHSARLQYVEFFGKYYESGGQKFDPLKIQTKYVRLKEDK